ncbi:MAG TPA: hypothetical protein DDY70_01805, partial [Clostridiales bacterium]|nr:hypothetical protein [Clostridiales bacterium]
LTGADEIERASWDTTLRLVDEEEAKELFATTASPAEREVPAMESEREAPPETAPAPTGEISPASDDAHYGLSAAACAFLRGVYEGDDTAVKDAVRASGLLPEGLVDEINEAFSEHFGDIVLEFDGVSATPLEDYREDIEEWLKK